MKQAIRRFKRWIAGERTLLRLKLYRLRWNLHYRMHRFQWVMFRLRWNVVGVRVARVAAVAGAFRSGWSTGWYAAEYRPAGRGFLRVNTARTRAQDLGAGLRKRYSALRMFCYRARLAAQPVRYARAAITGYRDTRRGWYGWSRLQDCWIRPQFGNGKTLALSLWDCAYSLGATVRWIASGPTLLCTHSEINRW